ncbi:hypothetical protein OG21DRAFT_1483403 [Imleria badia]|nr:hypothetical protein OG21DRAFT_1483403 [Imleria badia]
MRFSFFALLSGLAALVVVSALTAENLPPTVLSRDVSKPTEDGGCHGNGEGAFNCL